MPTMPEDELESSAPSATAPPILDYASSAKPRATRILVGGIVGLFLIPLTLVPGFDLIIFVYGVSIYDTARSTDLYDNQTNRVIGLVILTTAVVSFAKYVLM